MFCVCVCVLCVSVWKVNVWCFLVARQNIFKLELSWICVTVLFVSLLESLSAGESALHDTGFSLRFTYLYCNQLTSRFTCLLCSCDPRLSARGAAGCCSDLPVFDTVALSEFGVKRSLIQWQLADWNWPVAFRQNVSIVLCSVNTTDDWVRQRERTWTQHANTLTCTEALQLQSLTLVQISSLNVPDFIHQDPWIVPWGNGGETHPISQNTWIWIHSSTEGVFARHVAHHSTWLLRNFA